MSVHSKPGTSFHAEASKISETLIAFPGHTGRCWPLTAFPGHAGRCWPLARWRSLARVCCVSCREPSFPHVGARSRCSRILSAVLTILPVEGMPEIEPGVDLAALIEHHADLVDGDIVVVTSKIVPKAEGCTIELADVTPSTFATDWATRWNKDPRLVEIVLRESSRVVRQVGDLLITETRHGFVCANSGVDQSSSGAAGRVLVLPTDPDASARRLRAALSRDDRSIAVIVTDTFGRPWCEGQTDVAIGVAGMRPIQ